MFAMRAPSVAGSASALRTVWRDQPVRRAISRIDQPSRARSLMNSTSTILSTAFLLPASVRAPGKGHGRRFRRRFGGQLFGDRSGSKWSTLRFAANTSPAKPRMSTVLETAANG